MFQMASALRPGNIENIKQVAKSLHLLGKHGVAIEVYQEAMGVAGRTWDILNNIGLCYMNMHDYANAESFFRESVAETPQDAVYLNLGKVLTLQQKFQEAGEVYEQALLTSPQVTLVIQRTQLSLSAYPCALPARDRRGLVFV